MSGHSKWAQIKRQKGVNDQKRGQTFTKLSNAITIAVKQGGAVTDPNQNFRLRLAIEAARNVNMPKENIERAIKRASGSEVGDLSEVIYEGFAPGGASVIIEAATDNHMRTSSEIKSIFNKSGGSFGQPGSVAYQFRQIGRIVVLKNSKTFEEIFEIAVNAGAEDVEEFGDEVFIYTAVENLAKVKDSLSQAGLLVAGADMERVPIVPMEITEDDKLNKIHEFISALEALDDVQKVYTNLS
ncbi:MAG: YebC/PmpR family DNA-binding transcriptional regulator [Candidatus Levybacteria bacterium]|nr:YebC/PmpR family DNA-binding transcriptional regulator [Candidatus Levybacteria bacterium]